MQAKPETRLDYDWIGDAELLTAMVRAKGTPDAVAKFLSRRPKEVKNALQALAEADLYLREWVKAPGQYGLVSERGEQFFKDLPGLLDGKPLALQDASRAIAWTLFENGEKLNGRLYNYNVVFGKRAEDVLDRLSDDLGIPLETPEVDDEDSYEFDVGAEAEETSYLPLIRLLQSNDGKETAVEALIGVCDSIIASDKDQRTGSAALKAINTANAKLAEVDLSLASRNSYAAIDRQLESIIQRASELRKKLATTTAAGAS